MKIEILISTMNLNDHLQLIKNMGIKGFSVVINQVTKVKHKMLLDIEQGKNRLYSFNERGLSKSRNKAIEKSSGDVCVIADDDMYYVDDYEKIIIDSYSKYKDADIIAFYVDNDDIKKKKRNLKEGKVSFLKSMKLSSVQITFKRKSIIDNKIIMDERFGTGSTYFWGEENIFLFDCLRKGLKIYYVPIKIATLKVSESSWHRDNNELCFNIQGIIFYRMSKLIYPILIFQYAIRKKKNYINDLTCFQVIKYMFEGVDKFKSEEGKK